MAYQILTVANSSQLVIQRDNDPHHALTLADHRNLLLLRARLNAYLDTLQADGQIERAPSPPGGMISAIQARAEAEAHGQLIEHSTLRMAMTRATPAAVPSLRIAGRWQRVVPNHPNASNANTHRQTAQPMPRWLTLPPRVGYHNTASFQERSK